MNQQIYKKLKTGLGLWVILFVSIPSIALCEDIDLNMPIADGKKIVVELEKSNNYQQQIIILEKGNIQLTDQIKILQNQVIVLNAEMKIKAEQLALAEKQIQDQKQVYDDKVKICEDSKPSLIEKIGGIIGGIGIGILIGILL